MLTHRHAAVFSDSPGCFQRLSLLSITQDGLRMFANNSLAHCICITDPHSFNSHSVQLVGVGDEFNA